MAVNFNTIAVRTVSGKRGEKRGCYAPTADAVIRRGKLTP